MNICNSFDQVAHSLGISPARLRSAHRVTDEQIRDALAVVLQKHDARRASREVMDAATNFTTHMLAKTLTPVELKSNTRYLFTPGYTDGPPILPVSQNIEWGDRSVQWPTIALTGEAQFFAPGANSTKLLPFVDSADDLSEQNVSYYGVQYRWDQFELWEAGRLRRNVPGERQRAASMAMAELFEVIGGYGSNSNKMPGLFNHGNAITFDLTLSFGNPSITAEQALDQLSIIDLLIGRAAPNQRISGVIMPKLHRLNLMNKFIGTNNEGVNLWAHAKEMYPWLGNIIEDDRLLTAANDNGAQWTLWSADAMDLYREASSPQVFGPFDDQLETTFIVIQQDAGTICRRPELLYRVQMPA